MIMLGGLPTAGDGRALEVQSVSMKRQIVRRNVWRSALAAGCLAGPTLVGPAVKAEDFDPLLVYEEARALNDRWQSCAASFIKEWLVTSRSEEWLAEQALDRCRAEQNDLGKFLIMRVEETSAGNVMALLREKYRSGLIAAISELRTRDQGASPR
jgi:hypothetical protein